MIDIQRKIPVSSSVELKIFEEMKKRKLKNTQVFEAGLRALGLITNEKKK